MLSYDLCCPTVHQHRPISAEHLPQHLRHQCTAYARTKSTPPFWDFCVCNNIIRALPYFHALPLQRLACLRATIVLLRWRVSEPATCRSAANLPTLFSFCSEGPPVPAFTFLLKACTFLDWLPSRRYARHYLSCPCRFLHSCQPLSGLPT